MKILKEFEYYLKKGIIKKSNSNEPRAKFLIQEAERKKKAMEEKLEKIGLKDENANDFVEDCYDIFMFLIRAKLFKNGYSSTGYGAHEGEISYLRKIGFSESTVQFMNELRYFRNGIMYYGKRFDREYAQKVLYFLNKNISKFKS